MPLKINKILVANRGEIALRIMKTARKQGIKAVAVYSEADQGAPFVRFADESFLLGPPPANESYLKIDKIIDICKKHQVDAIHPGYGFLSENATFAEEVAKAGLIFIGPSSEAIRVMGDKILAKKAVKEYGVPLVPGMDEPISDIQKAKKLASEIGYPVLIKASAGGGGKGMRVVNEDKDFEEEMARAISEATSAFGNGSVFIEKYITAPKHIEVQIIGDTQGNVVHLFERDCSIQRRHQKVIEEAPSAYLNEEERKKIGEAAIQVAKSCNYHSTGTVEFIVDENKKFYFLEMNTRLQVEHPVTEEITGIDLVSEQINVACGHALRFAQDDLQIKGHSMEIRVYAEDPENNFAPSIGDLEVYQSPSGEGVRVDDGYREGMAVPIFYDPMISKLITFGKNREEAIERMLKAISEYAIYGIKTTLPFCEFALKHENFRSGLFTTKFVEEYFKPEFLEKTLDQESLTAVLAVAAKEFEKKAKQNQPQVDKSSSLWRNRLRD